MIGSRLGYLPGPELDRLLEHAGEVGRLITGLSNSLEARSQRTHLLTTDY
jgi:hypothetical protein